MVSFSKRSITLAELLIAIALVGLLVIAVFSLDNYARFHLITSDRRARAQNDVSYALEHMSKYAFQGIGAQPDSPPFEQIASGFRVRVDRNLERAVPQNPTPENLNDDNWINYTLSDNSLLCSCTQISAASPPCFGDELLSSHIITGVTYTAMPDNPTSGFYINLTENSSMVEIGIVSRYRPNNPPSLDNPQVAMKTRLLPHSSAAR
jgi:Tfp pilus assembly protein PilE